MNQVTWELKPLRRLEAAVSEKKGVEVKKAGRYFYPGKEDKDGVLRLPSGTVYERDEHGCLRMIRQGKGVFLQRKVPTK